MGRLTNICRRSGSQLNWGASPRCPVKRRKFQNGHGRWVFQQLTRLRWCAEFVQMIKIATRWETLHSLASDNWFSVWLYIFFPLNFSGFLSFPSFQFSWCLHAFYVSFSPFPITFFFLPWDDTTCLQLHFCMPSEGRHCNIPPITQFIVTATIKFLSVACNRLFSSLLVTTTFTLCVLTSVIDLHFFF